MNIGEVKKNRQCFCTCEIELGPADGNEYVSFKEVLFKLESDECWASQEITIEGVTIDYEPQRGGFEVMKGNLEELGYKKEDYYSIADFLQDILDYRTYGELTEDDYDGSGDNHVELYLNTLTEYIEEHKLIPFIDHRRGFANEWDIYFVPEEYREKIVEYKDVKELSIEKALDYVESSLHYGYSSTVLYEVTWVKE